MLTSILLVLVASVLSQVLSQETCKSPYVEQRLLADDVRYASPFYVIALPRTPHTVEMDNVCYTYFENGDGGFFHIMSITYKNGTNTYYDFSKGDISNRMGIAEAKSNECVYHDYTLKPICNVTVFILYRCYIEGKCSSNIDIGAVPGVDVRVTLAASPKISQECRVEAEASLRDTSELDGGDYVILPQKRTPNCVTKYDKLVSIGEKRALGPKTVSNDLTDRFASNQPAPPPTKPLATPTPQGPTGQGNFFQHGIPPPSAFNPYGYPANSAKYPAPTNVPASGSGTHSYAYGSSCAYSTGTGRCAGATYASVPPGNSPTPAWPPNYVQRNPPQWNIQPGAETHYHIWQSAGSAAALKSITAKNPNVIYHIHSWEQPAGCCKCA